MSENNKKELSDEQLNEVSGGSILCTENDCKNAGIDLLLENGAPGSYGYLYNTGDYHFQGMKISGSDVQALITFYKDKGHKAPTIFVARDYYKRISDDSLLY